MKACPLWMGFFVDAKVLHLAVHFLMHK